MSIKRLNIPLLVVLLVLISFVFFPIKSSAQATVYTPTSWSQAAGYSLKTGDTLDFSKLSGDAGELTVPHTVDSLTIVGRSTSINGLVIQNENYGHNLELTIKNLKVNGGNIAIGSAGTGSVLKLSGHNIIDATNTIQRAAIGVVVFLGYDEHGNWGTYYESLTIKNENDSTPGTLDAIGGRRLVIDYPVYPGAAIGGERFSNGSVESFGQNGNITIDGGIINATGHDTSTGIGGGCSQSSLGKITINGGTVTAKGGAYGYYGAAGIGGCSQQGTGDIEINGGIVHATGGTGTSYCGTGIGSGGDAGHIGEISINGGQVYAYSGDAMNEYSYSAGIGGGGCGNKEGASMVGYPNGSEVGTINITGGTVYAKGYTGIGCGYQNYDIKINISQDNPDNPTFVTASGSLHGTGQTAEYDLGLGAAIGTNGVINQSKTTIVGGSVYLVHGSVNNKIYKANGTTEIYPFKVSGLPANKSITVEGYTAQTTKLGTNNKNQHDLTDEGTAYMFLPAATTSKQYLTDIDGNTYGGTGQIQNNYALANNNIVFSLIPTTAVSFVTNGCETFTDKTVLTDANKKLTAGNIPPTTLNRSGYSFLGWYTKDASGKYTKYSDTITGNNVFNENTTLHILWRKTANALVVTTKPGDGVARLTWNDVNLKTVYQKGTSGDYTPVKTNVSNSTLVNGNNGSAYTFAVGGKVNGNFEISSADKDVTPKRLSAPTNVSATGAELNKVKITWDAVTDAEKYRIERSQGGDFTGVAIVDASTLLYEDDTVLPDLHYSYRVVALDVGGKDSPASNVATLTHASLAESSLHFDKNTTTTTDLIAGLNKGDYTLQKVMKGNDEVSTSQYIPVSDSFDINYLKSLEVGEHIFTFQMSGGVSPKLTIFIGDSTPGVLGNIVSVEPPTSFTVDYGTAFTALSLPERVNVSLGNTASTVLSLPVIWEQGQYTGNISGTYKLKGDISLIAGVHNPDLIQVFVDVTVKQKPPTPPNNTTIKITGLPKFVEVGKTATLTTTGVTTGSKTTWKSSNTNIATVSEKGVVKGIKAGTANITATSNGKSATITIKIVSAVAKVHTPVKTIYLPKKKSVTLPVLGYAKDNSNPKLVWKSSNSNIVKVNSKGKVTAGKKNGTAKITATAENGKAITVTVKVVSKSKKVTKISIKGSSKKMKPKQVKYLSVTTTPKKGTSAIVKWKTNKKSVVTVNKAGVIVAKKKGKARITASIGKVKKTITITVK